MKLIEVTRRGWRCLERVGCAIDYEPTERLGQRLKRLERDSQLQDARILEMSERIDRLEGRS